MEREQARDFDQELLNLYDDYAHGRLSPREFARKAAAFAVGGVIAEALLERLSPNYALAQQVAPDDARIHTEDLAPQRRAPAPRGGGPIRGVRRLLSRRAVQAAGLLGTLPGPGD